MKTDLLNILVPIVNVLSIYWDLFTGLDQVQSADFIFWYLCCQNFGTFWLYGCFPNLCTKCMVAWLHAWF